MIKRLLCYLLGHDWWYTDLDYDEKICDRCHKCVYEEKSK